MVYGIWLALLGVLGASSLIIAKKPDAKELIAKLAPYQGWIGAASALGGVWIIISSVLNLGWMTTFPIWWFSYLATGLLQASLGLLLGVGVLKQFAKSEAANQKMDQMIAKLAPYQGTLGLIAIGMGVWLVIASFMFYG